jgi:predicted esterase
VSPDQRQALSRVLKGAGAEVTSIVVDAGHGLTPRDVAAATQWFAERKM